MLKRSFTPLAVVLFVFALLAPSLALAQSQGASNVVMILPFENTSNLKEYNWIGESFADALSDLFNMPGMVVVSGDERELAYQRLRLPLTMLPSRATTIKVAREAKATLVIIGTYNVTPAQGEQTQASLRGTARVIKVEEGGLTGEMMPDGRWATHQYDFGGPLTDLQNMQGRLAYQILNQLEKALPFSMRQFTGRATKVPPRAFESYMKGVMTDDPEKRSAYLQNALRQYAKENAGATYPQAAFELGYLYFKQNDWKRAAEYFSKLQIKDPHYTEAAFYAALSYWRMNDLTSAMGALLPLTNEMPLTGIFNNAGALSAQAARSETKLEERDRLLKQALTFLTRAAESAPDDVVVRFNYAYTLFLSGKYAEAADQLRHVITRNPQDGAALFLFAKSLERTGRTEAANAADNEARRYLPTYARWQTEWEKSQTTAEVGLRLRMDFSKLDYIEEIRSREALTAKAYEGTSTQDLLAKARELYAAGQDDDVLPELNRVLLVEPMNAEAHFLMGRIYQRRGDLVKAISSLKTAIFWDAKLINAHILLGRIFLERGDRAMAMSYARNAIQIDPNNQEAMALHRQVEMGTR